MRETMIMSLAIIGSLLIQAYLLAAVLTFVTTAGKVTEIILDGPANKAVRNPASLFASLYRKLHNLSAT